MARVLFIDDNTDTLELLCQAATLVGHDSIACFNAAEAIHTALTNHPDVIFVDMHLAGTSGDELILKVRQTPELNQTPIIVLSAALNEDQKNLAIQNGASLCLQKPISLDELSAVIQQTL